MTAKAARMKTLTLIRHAKSSWKDPARDDFDRPLNKRGKHNAPDMARRLRKSGLQPDRWVASPARRARATAEAMAAIFGLPADAILWEERVYEASGETLLALVRQFDQTWQDVFLFGHNPGLTVLANLLGDRPVDNVPTCGVYRLGFAVDSWQEIRPGSGKCLLFDTPKRPK
jgi:phosphohistidine phosphatase